MDMNVAAGKAHRRYWFKGRRHFEDSRFCNSRKGMWLWFMWIREQWHIRYGWPFIWKNLKELGQRKIVNVYIRYSSCSCIRTSGDMPKATFCTHSNYVTILCYLWRSDARSAIWIFPLHLTWSPVSSVVVESAFLSWCILLSIFCSAFTCCSAKLQLLLNICGWISRCSPILAAHFSAFLDIFFSSSNYYCQRTVSAGASCGPGPSVWVPD